MSVVRYGLETYGAPVLAGFGAGPQDARFRVALDYLAAAHAHPGVAPYHLQAVAQPLQPADDLGRQPLLYY